LGVFCFYDYKLLIFFKLELEVQGILPKVFGKVFSFLIWGSRLAQQSDYFENWGLGAHDRECFSSVFGRCMGTRRGGGILSTGFEDQR